MRVPIPACLVFAAALASLGGCIDRDHVRLQSFSAEPNGSFTYSVQTNAVMTANDDGAAEQIRRDWLAETLAARSMCNTGYVVYQRVLEVPPQRVALSAAPSPANPVATTFFGNGGDVVYNGSCL